MVNQCCNTGCLMITFPDHVSNCTSCGYPLVDFGSLCEDLPQAQIDLSFGGIPHGNLSPAKSSPSFRGQEPPGSYESPEMHHNVFPLPHTQNSFPLPHTEPDQPALRSPPAFPNVHSSYQRSGHSPSTVSVGHRA